MKTVFIILFAFCCFTGSAQENETLSKTRQLIEKDQYLQAFPLLNTFISKDSTSSDAYTQRAKCFRKKGEYQSAFNDLKNAIRLNENNAEAYCTLGSAYAMTKQYGMSLQSYNKSIEIDAAYAPAYNSRGALYYYFLNENSKALDDFTEAIRLKPGVYNPYYNRGIVYRIKGENDKAIEDLKTALKLHPKDQLIYNEFGVCYMNMEQYDEAISNFSKSIKYNHTIDPFERLNTKELYRNIGQCYKALGQERKADRYFRKGK